MSEREPSHPPENGTGREEPSAEEPTGRPLLAPHHAARLAAAAVAIAALIALWRCG